MIAHNLRSRRENDDIIASSVANFFGSLMGKPSCGHRSPSENLQGKKGGNTGSAQRQGGNDGRVGVNPSLL